MRGKIILPLIAIIALAIVSTFQISTASAHPLPGAIFTTLPDGSVVNGNIYTEKCDVALNGGPRNPQSHHLPDGVYDVAVTDPSGKIKLGIGEDVVTIANGRGTFGPISLCKLVRPSPYDTTPNPGGVYKAWLCESGQLFVHHDCKTDNFKVRPSAPPSVVPTPIPSPTSPPTALIPPAVATPTPEVPTQLPKSGGEPPSNGNDVLGTKFFLVAGGSILSLLGGFVAWRRKRLGVF